MKMHLLAAVLAAAALSGCFKKEVHEPPRPMPTTVSTLEISTLLGGKMVPGIEKDVVPEFMLPAYPGPTGSEDPRLRFAAVRQFVSLGDDKAVVLLRTQMASTLLERANGHADPGLARLVYLKWDGRAWKLADASKDEIALGSSGEFGSADVLELKPGLKALLIHHGGVWQGNWADYGALVPLDGGKLRTLAKLNLGSGNGECPPEQDCFEAKSSVMVMREGVAPQDMPEIHLKQSLKQAISLFNEKGFSELTQEIQDYTRERYKTEPIPRRELQKDSLVVYKWNGSAFVKSFGEDIIPEI